MEKNNRQTKVMRVYMCLMLTCMALFFSCRKQAQEEEAEKTEIETFSQAYGGRWGKING